MKTRFYWKKLFTIASALGFAFLSVAKADDIAFFYALEADFRAVKDAGAVTAKPVKVGDRAIQMITLRTHKVYAVKMGSGPVETAISAESLLARFRCDRAFSLGPVGAISDKLEIGHWSRVDWLVAYQKGSWTNSGFQPKDGDINLAKELEPQSVVPSLFQKLSKIRVASGEIFVASNSYRERLREATNADAVDMNLFGLVSVCSDHHVPLINWRIVSDKADDNAGEDFRKFTETYDGAGGKAVAELIKNLPANPNSPQSYPELEKLLKNQ